MPRSLGPPYEFGGSQGTVAREGEESTTIPLGEKQLLTGQPWRVATAGASAAWHPRSSGQPGRSTRSPALLGAALRRSRRTVVAVPMDWRPAEKTWCPPRFISSTQAAAALGDNDGQLLCLRNAFLVNLAW